MAGVPLSRLQQGIEFQLFIVVMLKYLIYLMNECWIVMILDVVRDWEICWFIPNIQLITILELMSAAYKSVRNILTALCSVRNTFIAIVEFFMKQMQRTCQIQYTRYVQSFHKRTVICNVLCVICNLYKPVPVTCNLIETH